LLALERAGRIEACRSEERALGVFLSGVSQAALNQILWMEPKPPFAASEREVPNLVMNYLHAQLNTSEARTEYLSESQDACFQRRQVLDFLRNESH
jgi:hypothetical protein